MALVQTKPLEADRFIDRGELERVIGWRPGVAAVRHARGHDMPAFYRVGRLIKYRESDVLAWLERQRVEPVTSR